jgi:hypothetical protein
LPSMGGESPGVAWPDEMAREEDVRTL